MFPMAGRHERVGRTGGISGGHTGGPAGGPGEADTLLDPRGESEELAVAETQLVTTGAEGAAEGRPQAVLGPGAHREESDVTPESPGRYEYLQEVGRGGIGRVLLAYDRHTGRQVAVKELLSVQLEPTAGAVRRFLREARVTAQLEHPGIVPVYEIGRRSDGTFYYVMRLIRGRTLAGALAEAGDLSSRMSLLHHFLNLCHAVAFAHSKGVLHRDLKPHNVMIGEFGETILIDWGLAKGAESLTDSEYDGRIEALRQLAEGETMLGKAVGTPAYMPPEQARGRPVDEAADVYALGAVLYEILTGRPPFLGRNAQEILLQVLAYERGVTEVLKPTDLEPEVPADLAAVAMRALSRHPEDRYPSARELAADVENFLTGRHVTAYRYSPWEALLRFVRRHKAAVTAAASILIAVVAALVVVSLSYRREAEARRQAVEARRLEHSQRLEAHLRLAEAYVARAEALVQDKRDLEAGAYGLAAIFHNPASPLSPFFTPSSVAAHPKGRLLLAKAAATVYLARHSGIWGLAASRRAGFGPKRVFLLPDMGSMVVGRQDGRSAPHVLGVGAGGQGPALPVGRLLARAGSWILLAGPDGTALRVNVRTGRRWVLKAPPWPSAGALWRDGRVALGYADGRILLVAADRGVVVSLPAFVERVWAMAACGEGTLVAAAERVSAWRISIGSAFRDLGSWQVARVRALAMPASCSFLAAGTAQGAVLVWRWPARIGALPLRLDGHHDAVQALAFDAAGSRLVSVSWDGTMRVWDPELGIQLASVTAHRQGCRWVDLSPDGRMAVSVGDEPVVRIWRLRRPLPILQVAMPGTSVKAVAYSPDGRTVAAADDVGGVAAWPVGSTGPLWRYYAESTVRALAFGPSGRLILGTWAGTVSALGKHLSQVGRLPVSLGGPVRSLLVCRRQGWFLAAGLGGEVGRWRMDGKGSFERWRLDTRIFDCALSWDCRQVACGLGDGRVLTWRVGEGPTSGHVVSRFASPATAVAFHPSGKVLAAASRTGEIRILSLKGSIVATLKGHRRWVNRLAFSPWWDLLASAGDDRRVWIWDVHTWQPVLVLPTSREAVAVVFSPDGRTLAVGDGRLVRFYPMEIPASGALGRFLRELIQRLPTLPQELRRDLGGLAQGVRP